MGEIQTRTLAECEAVIAHGLQTFYEVGDALLYIRDNNLYQQQYGTFEEYCREKFGMARRTAYQMMEAAEVISNVRNCAQILPANESQARILTPFSPEVQREIWSEVVGRTQDTQERITAGLIEDVRAAHPHVGDSSNLNLPFDYKRDTKVSVPAILDKSQPFDRCQTPAYALDPLLPYLCPYGDAGINPTLWEPACGEGLLVEGFFDSGFKNVHSSDILTGQNFFEYEPPDPWDCLVTNPPYSLKFQWLQRCYSFGKPFALLLPVETLGAVTAQLLFQEYGVELLLLNHRVDFKMPLKGWDGAGSQFSVAWFCWRLLPQEILFGKIKKRRDESCESTE